MNYPLTPHAASGPAAFLLAGGASRRMGSDKALLPFGGQPLLLHLTGVLRTVAPEVHILAPAGRYESFGLHVLADLRPDCGPLGGIEAALTHSSTEWNFILACDLPYMTTSWLQTLAATAVSHADLQLIASGDPPNPLAALWHRSALPAVSAALDRGQFRVRDLLAVLTSKIVIPQDPQILANWNRPEDTQNLGC
jgi:molybdopterin-guanine dinucleotide biosynthesis protein A